MKGIFLNIFPRILRSKQPSGVTLARTNGTIHFSQPVALLLPVANVLLGSLHNDNRDFKIGFCLIASIEFPSCLRSTLTGLDEMVFKLR